MKKILLILVIAILSVSLFACSEKKEADGDNKTTTDSSAAADEKETAAPVEVFVIKTDYADLKYPKKWEDRVKVDVKDNTVAFSADKKPLFDLVFNGKDGFVLGTIKKDDGNIVVRIVDHKLNEKDKKYNEYAGMQNDVNVIIDHLREDYDFAIEEDLSEDDEKEVFEIETSLGKLYYPTKWKKDVKIDVEDQAVKFSTGKVKLFDLLFGGKKGDLLGTYNGTEIRLVNYDINQKDYKEDEYFRLSEMQMDVNVILKHLMEDKNFKIK